MDITNPELYVMKSGPHQGRTLLDIAEKSPNILEVLYEQEQDDKLREMMTTVYRKHVLKFEY